MHIKTMPSRFANDPAFGHMCKRFRDGVPTLEDFEMINKRLVSTQNRMPNDIRVACHTNKQREAVNVATWVTHLDEHGSNQGFVILADELKVRRQCSNDQPLRQPNAFYSNVGEADCSTAMDGRFSPMLRLHPMVDLMITVNLDVGNTLANGTQGKVKRIILKPSETTHRQKIDAHTVDCVYASQVDHLLFLANGKEHKIAPMKYSSIKVNYSLPQHWQLDDSTSTMHVTANQLPLMSNTATTGHKLQGSSLDAVYVPDWNYSVNWPYVVISRVRTLQGLFIGKKLDPSKDYSVPVELQRLMRFFHSYKKPASFDATLLNLDTPVF